MTDMPLTPDRLGDIADLSGYEVAGCRILSRLGSGAMGTVYLAEQAALKRQIALKVLKPEFCRDHAYIERFEREAQASAKLVHFNVVPVYHFGLHKDIYYIISGYVKGTTVQKIIDRTGPIPAETSTDMVLQAARGLSAAEDVGIIHRDIKPENLMVDQDGIIKVADFGLAKVVKDNDASITQNGMIVGTPYYISPEQAQGQELDARSDIYSLGVTFYHMLTGKVPFNADNVVRILLQHISADRPDPRAIRQDVPKSVSGVVRRMMARNPDERYASFDELIIELEGLLESLQSAPEIGAMSSGMMQSVAPEQRFKRISRTSVVKIARKRVTDEQLASFREKCHRESGLYVESETVHPADSVVEVQFSVDGRAASLQALGVVLYTVDSGPEKGMGVGVITIREMAPEQQGEMARALGGSAGVMQALTRTPLHCRLLKYYYSNTDKPITRQQVASALGTGARMIEEPLSHYFRFGLALDRESDNIAFRWPADKELQHAIVNWINKHGLR